MAPGWSARPAAPCNAAAASPRWSSRRPARPAAGEAGAAVAPWQQPLGEASHRQLGRRVLIIAELSLRQCRKYRVDQKVDMLARLGHASTVIAWNHLDACRHALQSHGLVVFYRTPGFPGVLALADEARRLGVPSYFDVDDLIFDAEEYARNSNIGALPAGERRLLLDGAQLYHAMLVRCDHAIASTATIARYMRQHCRGEVFVVENALDGHLLELAGRPRQPPGGDVVIGYGSGTRTHDFDFRQAAPALLRILDDYPAVRLALYGHLELPEELAGRAAQVVRVPMLDPDDYYLALARFGISLAPLEGGTFNDAKSNIKFLEAGLFGVPTVASPAAAFRQVIRHGENGLLAATAEDWYAALASLIGHPAERARLGEAARHSVLGGYHPDIIARSQLEPVLRHALPPRRRGRRRILLVNLLFAPQSFGGATIVVEQLARELASRPDIEVGVFTASWAGARPAYQLARYEWQGIPVTVVELPPGLSPTQDWHHPEVAAVFAEHLAAAAPDLVHLHAVQRLGADLADACPPRRGRRAQASGRWCSPTSAVMRCTRAITGCATSSPRSRRKTTCCVWSTSRR
jgi:glycosyltransferase involved in cell wall biosynthesis